MVKAIKLNDKDNVASVFDQVGAGSVVTVMDKKGTGFDIRVNQNIPYGHKIALVVISPGERIIKYGEEIGVSVSEIKPGDHVHVHNIESLRGRGDWAKADAQRGEDK